MNPFLIALLAAGGYAYWKYSKPAAPAPPPGSFGAASAVLPTAGPRGVMPTTMGAIGHMPPPAAMAGNVISIANLQRQAQDEAMAATVAALNWANSAQAQAIQAGVANAFGGGSGAPSPAPSGGGGSGGASASAEGSFTFGG